MIKYKQFLLVISLLVGTGCEWRAEQARNILQKRSLREDIFFVILEDTAYLSELISKASKDSLAKSVLRRSAPLAKLVCTSSVVDSLLRSDAEVNRLLAIKLVHRMEEDTASCQLMCSMVLENPLLRRHIEANVCPYVERHHAFK